MAGRTLLTTNTTYNVPADYPTLQAAVDFIGPKIDTAGFNVIIQLANSVTPYPGPFITTLPVGGGNLIIQGNAADKTLVSLDDSVLGTYALNTQIASSSCALIIKNLTIAPANAGSGGIELDSTLSTTAISNVLLKAPAGGGGVAIASFNGNAAVIIGADPSVGDSEGWSISGNWTKGIYTGYFTYLELNGPQTSVSTPNFSAEFLDVAIGATVVAAFTTFSGAATGSRFLVEYGATVWTSDQGLNFFPGNAAGTIEEGGQYDDIVGPLPSLNVATTAQFDKTNDTTLANIPGLTVNVDAGGTYAFTAALFTTSNVGTGVKAAIAGTCTATSFICEADTVAAGVITQSRTTTKGNAVGGVTAVTASRIDIIGTIVVANAGTLTVQFAENAAIAATTSSVLINSTFEVTRLS